VLWRRQRTKTDERHKQAWACVGRGSLQQLRSSTPSECYELVNASHHVPWLWADVASPLIHGNHPINQVVQCHYACACSCHPNGSTKSSHASRPTRQWQHAGTYEPAVSARSHLTVHRSYSLIGRDQEVHTAGCSSGSCCSSHPWAGCTLG